MDGVDVGGQVHDSLDKCEAIVSRIRTGVWRGYSGKAITDVVNIGVGGSDLGPLMAATALEEWADTDIRVHFVSNMDGTQLDGLLKKLNPQTTLFIISSKSFGTIDTHSQTPKLPKHGYSPLAPKNKACCVGILSVSPLAPIR